MKRIRRFFALSRQERSLLFSAAMSLVAVRIALRVLPFSRVLRIVERWPRLPAPIAPFSVQRAAWAIQRTACWVPWATCLTQALALAIILRRAGQHTELNIGVANDPGTGFEAHAWLRCEGRVALGDNGRLSSYVPILSLLQR